MLTLLRQAEVNTISPDETRFTKIGNIELHELRQEGDNSSLLSPGIISYFKKVMSEEECTSVKLCSVIKDQKYLLHA